MHCKLNNFQHIKKILCTSVDNLILQIKLKFQVDRIKIVRALLLTNLKKAVLRKTSLNVQSLVTSRFRFSISPVQVRELTLYTLLIPTSYIVIPVLGLSLWTITKNGAREREIICFEMFK